MLLEQIRDAPGVSGLVDHHLMSARLELARATAQEMGVAVIPVGDQRVVEHHDTHSTTSVPSRRVSPRASYASRYSVAIACAVYRRARLRALAPSSRRSVG